MLCHLAGWGLAVMPLEEVCNLFHDLFESPCVAIEIASHRKAKVARFRCYFQLTYIGVGLRQPRYALRFWTMSDRNMDDRTNKCSESYNAWLKNANNTQQQSVLVHHPLFLTRGVERPQHSP